MSRILAVDYGLKRLGLALSDENQILASPLQVLLASKTLQQTAEALVKIAEGHKASKILMGNPLHLSGKKSFLSDEVALFIQMLKQLTSLPIILWDERLTSAEAERTLKLGGVNRKKRTAVVDCLAAVILLQSYLDSQKQI
jgi:putative Holliday junction resolvase